MGFLESIISTARNLAQERGSAVTNQSQASQERSLLDGVVDLFKADGANGLMNRFKSLGLGDVFSSWIGKGSNMPISASQLRDVLGADRIRQLAQRAGITEDKVPEFLRNLLPNLVDRATPGGAIDPDNSGQGPK